MIVIVNIQTNLIFDDLNFCIHVTEIYVKITVCIYISLNRVFVEYKYQLSVTFDSEFFCSSNMYSGSNTNTELEDKKIKTMK